MGCTEKKRTNRSLVDEVIGRCEWIDWEIVDRLMDGRADEWMDGNALGNELE